MDNWFHWQGNDLLVNVKVQPGARRDEIVEIYNGALKIKISAPPVDGTANKHLCAYLAKFCKVRKANVTIESGSTSKTKTIRIQLAEQKLPDFVTRK